MNWEVVVGRRAAKTLKEIPQPQRGRIIQGIDRLRDGPCQAGLDVKQLRGRPEWRLRVGDWRILFLVHAEEIRILVVSVSPRGDAYKGR